METNNSFSVQRFFLLCKQSLIINKKIISISLAGFVGILFIALILFQSASQFSHWENNNYQGTFLSLFFTLGIIISGHAFPAFRTKEKSMTYLMLPVSASEKFTFEFLVRIVLFILVLPSLFWVVANLEGAIVHHFVPELTNYKYSFIDKGWTVNSLGEFWIWKYFAITQGVLFVFISAFTGASYFAKSPLLKTMSAVSILFAGFALFTFLLVKGMNLEAFHPARNRAFFISDEHNAMVFMALGVAVINLCLLVIAYFRLKEKEA